MVAKLLLAVQERAIEVELEGGEEAVLTRLTATYRRVRDGLGYRKDPATYGAFPIDGLAAADGRCHTLRDREVDVLVGRCRGPRGRC